MPTIKIDVPEVMETRAYTKAKGEDGRTESALVIRHHPAKWDASVREAIWLKGVQRFANDYYVGESDPKEKAERISAMVAAFNEGQTLVDVTGKAPRASKAGADPVQVRARTLARRAIKAKMDAADYKARFTDADAADQIAALDAIIEKNPAIRDKAAAELEAERQMAEGLVL